MNKFTIRYPNGIKRHVKKAEIILLGDSLRQTGPHEYSADSLSGNLQQSNSPHYLPGVFVIEHKGKRRKESLESTAGMIGRLQKSGALA